MEKHPWVQILDMNDVKDMNNIFKTANIIHSESPINRTITYLDDNLNEKILECKIILNSFDYYCSDEDDLKIAEFGFEAKKEIYSIMANYLKNLITNNLIKKYQELGLKTKNNLLTKKQRFLKKIFKKLNFPIYLDNKSSSKNILDYILSKCNDCSPDFIILGESFKQSLQEIKTFQFQPENEIYYLATIKNIKLFINQNESFNKNCFILGKSTPKHKAGIYIVDGGDASITDYEHSIEGELLYIDKNLSIVEVGDNVSNYYYANELIFDKKPIWKKLLLI